MSRSRAITEAGTFPETSIFPINHLAFLSQNEIGQLIDRTDRTLYPLIRSCTLAVLSSGVATDNARGLFADYPNFDMEFERHPRGLKLVLKNAPAQAFVDGVLIETIHDHLFSVLRDLLHSSDLHIYPDQLTRPESADLVFQILRNAKVLDSDRELSCVVCWGGHSISKPEYDYAQAVGQELGLRRFDICTGCGPGAMKGSMRGALYAHKRQKYSAGRFIGISEPGIIAAEPPNDAVSDLVIMPDIEKRLEAFIRIAHGIVIFPGGPGTLEEILYLLAILATPGNNEDPLGVVLTGPESSRPIIDAYIEFLETALGHDITSFIDVVIGNPVCVAETIQAGREKVRQYRLETNDGYCFNWTLVIPDLLTTNFVPTHKSMSELNLSLNESPQELASALRRLFSGIVAGNVKPEIRRLINERGPFEIQATSELGGAIEVLLERLISENRMKIDGVYTPCYQINPNYKKT
tara:strand:+ start:834 stop:2231 length:1398 start_codon:yes stop_codon:yes gene_type:complete